jgi:hypothetical protein
MNMCTPLVLLCLAVVVRRALLNLAAFARDAGFDENCRICALYRFTKSPTAFVRSNGRYDTISW